MEHPEGSVQMAGAARAVVTVLRTLLDAQPDKDAVWERLRSEYRQAVVKFETDPTRAGERSSFEQVFDMLGVHVENDVAHDMRRVGRPPDSATANPTDGVDDASMY